MAGLCTAAGSAAAEDAGWRKIHEERGILVSAREEPGRELPTFRGQGRVDAPVLHVLAVLLDDEHSSEWAKGADQSRVLRKLDERTQIVYARSRQPWPVQDRDLVMKRKVEVVKANEIYRVHLTCAPNELPKVDGAVRIRECETSFMLRALDGDRTLIDYRVHADPGANTPEWIVRTASKNIPLDTLTNLRRQLARTRGKYDQAVAELSAL
ncbi:MAG TPA: START domain-containing protein [Polyangiales bacterium]